MLQMLFQNLLVGVAAEVLRKPDASATVVSSVAVSVAHASTTGYLGSIRNIDPFFALIRALAIQNPTGVIRRRRPNASDRDSRHCAKDLRKWPITGWGVNMGLEQAKSVSAMRLCTIDDVIGQGKKGRWNSNLRLRFVKYIGVHISSKWFRCSAWICGTCSPRTCVACDMPRGSRRTI
jgi:hypothetical protein